MRQAGKASIVLLVALLTGSCAKKDSAEVTYQQVATGTDVLLHQIVRLPAGELMVCGGREESGIVLRSADGGNTWTGARSFDQPIHSLGFADAYTGYAGGANAEVFKTTDGGLSWRKLWINAPAFPNEFRKPFRAVATPSDSVVLCVAGAGYEAGAIARSADAGANWFVDEFSFELRDILFFDALEGLACGFGVMMRTTDAGVTWKLVSAPDDHFMSLTRDGMHGAWAAGFDGGIYHSDDRGQKWKTVVQNNGMAGGRRHYRGISRAAALHVGCGHGGAIGFSRDGGSTWQEGWSFSGADIRSVLLLPGGAGVACGNGGRVFLFEIKN